MSNDEFNDVLDDNSAPSPQEEKKTAPKTNPAQAGSKKTPTSKTAKKAQEGGSKKGTLGNLESVMTRNNFYRDGYRMLLNVAVIEAFVIIALISALVLVLVSMRPQTFFFATTEDGRLIPIVSLDQPNLSAPAIVSWTAQAASETMTFGFHDFRRRLQESSRHFTRRGWESFTRALQTSGIIDAVTQNRQVLTATPRGAPTLVSEGIVNGRYEWQIEVPMLISYEFGSGNQQTQITLRLLVVRVPQLENANGVGIEQWIAYNG